MEAESQGVTEVQCQVRKLSIDLGTAVTWSTDMDACVDTVAVWIWTSVWMQMYIWIWTSIWISVCGYGTCLDTDVCMDMDTMAPCGVCMDTVSADTAVQIPCLCGYRDRYGYGVCADICISVPMRGSTWIEMSVRIWTSVWIHMSVWVWCLCR